MRKGNKFSADIITGLRIVCGLLILFFPPFSKAFYALYIFGGLTDAVDGTAARKLGSVSDAGAKLDTVADIVFAVCVLIKLLNAVHLPVWIIVWIAVIALIKALNIVYGFIRYHRFTAVHSVLNKICGGLVFLAVPVIGYLGSGKAMPALAATCAAATAAALWEGYCIAFEKGE